MSTVVVVKKGKKVAIAADTLTTFGDTRCNGNYVSGKNKILHSKDTYIGIVGSSAHNNVFQSIIQKHSELLSFKSKEDIFDTYLHLHPVLKEKYYINTGEGKDDSPDYESSQINALLANPYGIFAMYSWREVYEYERFWAIGSGRDFALGAMHAVYEQWESVEEIARIGVVTGCEFDNNSGLPCTLYALDLQAR